MLASTACDAVLVSTPTSTHFDTACEVIGAGRHLLLEKPAAVKPGEVRRLHELAAQAGVLFQTAFHMSRGAETDWLAAHLTAAGSAPTPVCAFAGVFHDPLCVAGKPDPRAPSVLGSWVDSGINALSVLARFLPAELLTVAAAHRLEATGGLVQEVQSTITLTAPGLHGTIHTDWTRPSDLKTTALHFGNGQSWLLDHNRQTATLYETDVSGLLPGLMIPPISVHRCQRHSSRMVDHYLGVFSDFDAAVTHKQTNAALSISLHGVLLQGMRS